MPYGNCYNIFLYCWCNYIANYFALLFNSFFNFCYYSMLLSVAASLHAYYKELNLSSSSSGSYLSSTPSCTGISLSLSFYFTCFANSWSCSFMLYYSFAILLIDGLFYRLHVARYTSYYAKVQFCSNGIWRSGTPSGFRSRNSRSERNKDNANSLARLLSYFYVFFIYCVLFGALLLVTLLARYY